MSIFGLGKKDESGRQVRIEHRGRFLRASRTGGVSLRAQAKVAGLNLTANSQHGFRVSRTVGKNTQLAFQNGRFVLRGRYGKGPTKLNLSKSGVTVSTRTGVGTVNWIKPKRSSAKLLGVQVRGQNAVYINALWALFALAAMLLTAAFHLAVLAAQVAWWLLLLAWQGLLYLGKSLRGLPYALTVLRRSLRNARLTRALKGAPPLDPALGARDTLLAALVLSFEGWGRGQDLQALKASVAPALAQDALLSPALPQLEAAATLLTPLRQGPPPWAERLAMAALGKQAEASVGAQARPEIALALDDLMLRTGPKTRLQEQMLEVFCDFAGLRLTASTA